MTQKLIKIGDSAGVTIPKKSLKDLGLEIGDDVEVTVDPCRKVVSIKPADELSPEDAKIAKLTLRFIDRYRKDLEALAQK